MYSFCVFPRVSVRVSLSIKLVRHLMPVGVVRFLNLAFRISGTGFGFFCVLLTHVFVDVVYQLFGPFFGYCELNW
jgi:hypothetical protein